MMNHAAVSRQQRSSNTPLFPRETSTRLTCLPTRQTVHPQQNLPTTRTTTRTTAAKLVPSTMATAPAAPPGGFNKMFVMLPVMLAARKLDGENPDTIQMVRIAYGLVQLICVSLVLYAYFVASAVTSSTAVLVPPAPTVRSFGWVVATGCLAVTSCSLNMILVSRLPTRMPRKSTRRSRTEHT